MRVWTEIYLIQDRKEWRDFVNTVMNIWISQVEGNFLTYRSTVSFSVRTLCHSSGGQSPAYHCGGPRSMPGHVTWSLWWT
jgi:hypothetical protein